MFRRDLIKGLVAGVGIIIPLKAKGMPETTKAEAVVTHKLLDAYEYRGFRVFWTGWKFAPDSTLVAGQWIAWKLDGKAYIYSSVPGSSGRYEPGQCFNLTRMPWQNECTKEQLVNRPDIAELEKKKAKEIIELEIDFYHQPSCTFRYKKTGHVLEIVPDQQSRVQRLLLSADNYEDVLKPY